MHSEAYVDARPSNENVDDGDTFMRMTGVAGSSKTPASNNGLFRTLDKLKQRRQEIDEMAEGVDEDIAALERTMAINDEYSSSDDA